ncbi:MAG TPA: hypothetical protein VFZ29_07955 [Solirubrobacterales bacterium]
MKYLKMLGVAAVAAMAFMAFAAGSASATTLELNGTTTNASVTLSGEIEGGTSATLARTDGSLANTCTSSKVAGSTATPFTGSKVTGAVSSLSFGGCSETVTVDKNGSLYVEHISGGTNGTVSSEEAEVTVKTPFGNEVNCKTSAGTDIGTLTGASSGTVKMDINAVLNCGFLLPSATWKGTYVVTTSGGQALGVSA